MANCPPQAYGFIYAKGPPQVKSWYQLRVSSGYYFVDAIVIPTARLEEYCTKTGAYHDFEELLRNGEGAPYQAHTRDGRFFPFDPSKDKLMSTEFVGELAQATC